MFEIWNDFGFMILQGFRFVNFILGGKAGFKRRNPAKLGAFRSEKGCFSRKHLTFLHYSN
ncbi:MAG TPA: hypothetical protein DCQ12_07600 [Candidatus Cloacimonas sp.]|nr:hypothetical protein [Candidatus Cloacimonas sp.]